jgi:cysteine desulfurase
VYEKKGFPCSFVSSDVHGHLSFEELEAVLSSEVALVSLSWVHHEIGVVQDIARVRALMRERAPQALLHIDASQAPLWRGVFPHTLGADLLTLDAHKMRGPKGVGCLFVRSGVVFDPLILGGGQEGGRRAGTPAVEIISGFAEAVRLVAEEREGWVARVREAHDVFVARVQELVPEAVLYSGTGKDVAPHLALFSFPQKKSDEMVLALDKRGVACSAGSACTRDGGNKTLRALGFEKEAEHAVRFSFDTDISREDAILVAEKIGEVLQRK